MPKPTSYIVSSIRALNKTYKSQIFNLYVKNEYGSIFSFEGISMGSGKKCSQFLKNPLSMKFYTVLYCQCTVLIECMLLATTQLWLEYPFAFCVQIAWVAWVAWVREWRG